MMILERLSESWRRNRFNGWMDFSTSNHSTRNCAIECRWEDR